MRSYEPDGPLNVLFVCTANIARSPYAERRAAHLVESVSDGDTEIASAGVPGFPGRDMDRFMAAELERRGGEWTGHVSRSLTRDTLADASLVVTFEFAHRVRIADAWPDQEIKVFGLHQLAEGISRFSLPRRGLALLDGVYETTAPDGMHLDVLDPHGRGRAAARRCADEIDAALAVIVPALSGLPPLAD